MLSTLQHHPTNYRKTVIRPEEQLVAPLSATEESHMTKLVRIKLATSQDKVTVRCKTGGQPIILKKIPKPRKGLSVARDPLLKKRASHINKLTMDVSGKSSSDSLTQQSTVLKTASKVRRKIILESAGCGEVSLSATQGAALRPMLGLSLTKYREHKKFFKSLGVKFASEEKEKREQIRAQCGEVQVEMRSVVFLNEDGREELRPTPVASIEDVPSFVSKLLDEYDRQNRLTWHEGVIPDNEIWVKIGGDHGGGSFKLMLQVANLKNANSKMNTCLLQIVECKDSAENLRRLLGPYRDQISALQGMEWRGKKTRVFLFGDYDFLTKLFGLSGAQGTHPCLYCTASKGQIHMPPAFCDGNITQRSLTEIRQDYRRYVRSGKKKTTAKLHNNVIRKPIVEVDLNQVAPPYLHILLGVVKKHHDLLERDCHSLDQQIAKVMAQSDAKIEDLSASFQLYVEQLKQKEKKQRRIRMLQSNIVAANDPAEKETTLQRIAALRNQLKSIVDPLQF